jgi:hypothetical protein
MNGGNVKKEGIFIQGHWRNKMKTKINFFKKIPEYLKKFFKDTSGALLSLNGTYVKNGEIVNVNQVKG